MNPVSIHDYLRDAAKYPAKPVCVVYGSDPFLRSTAVRSIRDHVLAAEDAEFSYRLFEGDETTFKEVLGELQTVAMFGGDRRVVRVDGADKFISSYQSELENYVAKPSNQAVLILQLNAFDARRILYKKVAETGLLIEIKVEKKKNGQIDEKKEEKMRPSWVVQWSKDRHNTPCDLVAAEMIVQRIGLEYGLLDQELAKLALMATDKKGITVELVKRAVGSWRSRTAYDMLNLALEGNTVEAIRQLDALMLAGVRADDIVNPIAANLRKLAAATELILNAERQGSKLLVRTALDMVGVHSFYLGDTEKQLIRLGRHRGAKLPQWLLQLALDLRGDSRSDPRLILETFIVKLSSSQLRGTP